MSSDSGPSAGTLAADAAALESLERKLHLVRDRVAAVARGYQTGLYLCGAGGVGKSYTVLRHLDEVGAAYRLLNSRLTAKGLFLALGRAPDAIYVLEDMERLTHDRDAQGVLRSALWAQPGHDRAVTWTTATGGEERVVYRGGIIMIANRPLADLPELRALATRICVHRLDVTDAEIVALIRDLASRGYERDGKRPIGPEAAREVADYLIAECQAAGCRPDLRLLVKAYQIYLQWEADLTRCGWRDLVAADVRETAHHFREEVSTLSREDRHRQRRQVVREIMAQTGDPNERVRLYCERTGKSRADYYRREREVRSGEFLGEG